MAKEYISTYNAPCTPFTTHLVIDSSLGDYLDSQDHTTTDTMHIVKLIYKNNSYTLSIQLSFARQSGYTVLMSMLITSPEGAQTQSMNLYKK